MTAGRPDPAEVARLRAEARARRAAGFADDLDDDGYPVGAIIVRPEHQVPPSA